MNENLPAHKPAPEHEEQAAVPDPAETVPRDPISGEPGAHPVATGVTSASVAVAGAAVGASVGGPIGAVVGGLVGAVAGAAAGHVAGEAIEGDEPTDDSESHNERS